MVGVWVQFHGKVVDRCSSKFVTGATTIALLEYCRIAGFSSCQTSLTVVGEAQL